MRELEPIMKYGMDPVESRAYKIALLWQDECRREIPKEPYARLASNSDPRKSMLFKYCFKLARETSGILADKDIQLYIRAQIQVLKSIDDGKVHALIEPHCLVGDKAWKRWKIWKSRYDKVMSKPLPSPSAPISASEIKIKSDLSSSLEFLKKRGCDEADKFREKSRDVRAWAESGEVSRFYAVLSPWFRSFVGEPSSMEFDHHYYRSSVTPEIERFFRERFAHEFRKEKEACRGA